MQAGCLRTTMGLIYLCCPSPPIKESNFKRRYLNVRLTSTRSGTSSSRSLAFALGEADAGLSEVSIAVHNIIWKILQLSSSSNPSLSLLSGLPFIGHCAPGNFSLIKNNPKEFSIGFMQLEKQHVCTLPIYDPTVPESIK